MSSGNVSYGGCRRPRATRPDGRRSRPRAITGGTVRSLSRKASPRAGRLSARTPSYGGGRCRPLAAVHPRCLPGVLLWRRPQVPGHRPRPAARPAAGRSGGVRRAVHRPDDGLPRSLRPGERGRGATLVGGTARRRSPDLGGFRHGRRLYGRPAGLGSRGRARNGRAAGRAGAAVRQSTTRRANPRTALKRMPVRGRATGSTGRATPEQLSFQAQRLTRNGQVRATRDVAPGGSIGTGGESRSTTPVP